MSKETGVLQISGGLMQALHRGGLDLNAFSKDILVLECLVSGTSFCNLEKIEPELECGKSELKIVREGKNKHDRFALRLTFNDHKVGYIPRGKNEVIARLMDSGKQFFAKVMEKEWEGTWLRLEISVFLKD